MKSRQSSDLLTHSDTSISSAWTVSPYENSSSGWNGGDLKPDDEVDIDEYFLEALSPEYQAHHDLLDR